MVYTHRDEILMRESYSFGHDGDLSPWDLVGDLTIDRWGLGDIHRRAARWLGAPSMTDPT